MSRIAYVAGQYLPHRRAAVHIEDRGYQFADGVYEVISVVGGCLVDAERHLKRLHRSLGELRIPMPLGDAALGIVMREVIRRNGVDTGIVYLQVTRGVAPREHAFPKAAKPALVVTSRRSRPPDPRLGDDGIAVITIPDIRWQRCDIKSIALVANVLGKQAAREAGAYEAWQVDSDGRVTEGTSTNAWIVTGEGEVVTRAADNAILNGVTRLAIFDIIGREGYRLVERAFSVAEAKAAREAFLTSTTADLLPVVRIDGAPVGEGRPGPLAQKLRAAYFTHADWCRMTGGTAPMRHPRAILFDWDNTLVDSWATIHEALNFLMRAMEKPEWSLAETRERVRLSLREAFPPLFGERWEEAREIYLGRFRAIHLDRLTPLPGRDKMLRALAEREVFLGVVSNKTGELLRREVARLGWSGFFGSIVGAGDAAVDKPASDPIHLALAPSGVPAGEEVWFVGDTAIDMECALNSGCIAVLLGDAAPPEEFAREFARFAPHLSFADETSLFRSLEGLRFGAPRPSS